MKLQAMSLFFLLALGTSPLDATKGLIGNQQTKYNLQKRELGLQETIETIESRLTREEDPEMAGALQQDLKNAEKELEQVKAELEDLH